MPLPPTAPYRCLLSCRLPPSPRSSLPGRAVHRPRGDARASAPVEAGLVRGVLCHGHGPGHEVLRIRGKNILELGIGTGPNFKYYASDNGVNVIGVDPNKHMEDYGRTAAESAGLPPSNFTFKRGVAEALPVEDNSLDVVIGTLVLCSVNNIDMALREIYRVLKPGGLYLFVEHVAAPDGSLLRFLQGAFDPLQQFVADGCHLTRKTGENIRDGGFSSLSLDSDRLSNAYIISPHVYGVASK